MSASRINIRYAETLLYTGDIPPLTTPVQYIVAANGIFKRAANCCLDVAALVQPFAIPLPDVPSLRPYARWRLKRLPAAWLTDMLAAARNLTPMTEILFHVRIKEGQVHLLQPPQRRAAMWVEPIEPPPADSTVLCELHSHHRMPTEFSRIDNDDEQSLRFYAVFGWSTGKPTIRLRAGVYGYFVPVPLTTVFDGNGPFEDLYDAADYV